MNFIKIPNQKFEMQDAPVTQSEWQEVMGTNPSHFKGQPDNPVEAVSFNDIMEFLSRLNEKQDGYTYRLPSEEEWWYCAKPCDDQPIEEIAWSYENSNESTQPVKTKTPNSYGLYDMLGNVWEWTRTQKGPYHVTRGGSWYGPAAVYLRSAACGSGVPDVRRENLGFRLVRTCSTEHSNSLTLESRTAQAIAKVQKALDELKEIVKGGTR